MGSRSVIRRFVTRGGMGCRLINVITDPVPYIISFRSCQPVYCWATPNFSLSRYDVIAYCTTYWRRSPTPEWVHVLDELRLLAGVRSGGGACWHVFGRSRFRTSSLILPYFWRNCDASQPCVLVVTCSTAVVAGPGMKQWLDTMKVKTYRIPAHDQNSLKSRGPRL